MEYTGYKEGRAPFHISSRNLSCETYYKVYGDLSNSRRPPVIVLHGGPGAPHEYLEPYALLWQLYDIPVIFYDQLGCGYSTLLPETVGDHSFWNPDLFVTELDNLIDHLHLSEGPLGYDVLGHSWGGTFAIIFAARQPRGLRKLVLASATADHAQSKDNLWKLAKRLEPEHQRAFEMAVEKNDFTSQAYLDALGAFMKKYFSYATPYPPPEIARSDEHMKADYTVRATMQGPSPFAGGGTLKTWSNIPYLSKINVPTLVYNGEDETTREDETVPLFEHIPRVKWKTIPRASHMMHLDSPEMQETIMKLVRDFLTS